MPTEQTPQVFFVPAGTPAPISATDLELYGEPLGITHLDGLPLGGEPESTSIIESLGTFTNATRQLTLELVAVGRAFDRFCEIFGVGGSRKARRKTRARDAKELGKAARQAYRAWQRAALGIGPHYKGIRGRA